MTGGEDTVIAIRVRVRVRAPAAADNEMRFVFMVQVVASLGCKEILPVGISDESNER